MQVPVWENGQEGPVQPALSTHHEVGEDRTKRRALGVRGVRRGARGKGRGIYVGQVGSRGKGVSVCGVG